MKSSASTFKPLKNHSDISKKSDLIFNVQESLCYNHVCMEMIFLCVII
jgi:hypothetical protein